MPKDASSAFTASSSQPSSVTTTQERSSSLSSESSNNNMRSRIQRFTAATTGARHDQEVCRQQVEDDCLLLSSSSSKNAKSKLSRGQPPNQNNNNNHQNNHNNNKTFIFHTHQQLRYLCAATLAVLWLTGGLVAAGVHIYTQRHQTAAFATAYEQSQTEIARSFHTVLERQLQAAGSLSRTITAYATTAQQQGQTTTTRFPFVTVPHWELLGSDTRILSGSHTVRFLPLVHDRDRAAWEDYARQQRPSMAAAHQREDAYRHEQDAWFVQQERQDTEEKSKQDKSKLPKDPEYQKETPNDESSPKEPLKYNRDRTLVLQSETDAAHSDTSSGLGEKKGGNDNTTNNNNNTVTSEEQPYQNLTVEDDGYHARIWRGGKPDRQRDEFDGSGPFLPEWQKSPVMEDWAQSVNLNWFSRRTQTHLRRILVDQRQAVLNMASVTNERYQLRTQTLAQSQYRHKADEYVGGMSSVLVYPVLENLEDDDAPVAGAIVTSIYWKVLLSDLLPDNQRGIIVTVKNGYGQVFYFRLDGPEASYLGTKEEIGHEKETLFAPQYKSMLRSYSVNGYMKDRANPTNTPYRAIPLSEESAYSIHIYPTTETAAPFESNKPLVYVFVVLSCFVLASVFFLVFAHAVERRQQIMFRKVVQNAQKAAAAERELNEFMSHEVRNPLASAMSACVFITTAVHEANPLSDPETIEYVRQDLDVVNTSLSFINDFLRSMLDIHRANMNQIKIRKTVVDVKQDILESVAAILYKRVALFDVQLECPDDLLIETDAIRLKQVILNLARNSAKFVQKGFIRLRATVNENNSVSLLVEDSGPGIPAEKRTELFAKYQDSLDLLNQGTGLGLSLCQKLVQIMEGDIWLDSDYDSGMEGCPGARFVVDLHTAPVVHHLEDSRHRSPAIAAALAAAATTTTPAVPTKTPSPAETPTPSNASGTEAAVPQEQGRVPTIDAVIECRPTSSVVLPALGDVENQLPQAKPAESSEPKSLPLDQRVLFVDDDSILRKLMVRAVRKLQPTWQLMEAASGEAGLQLCETHTFDLIFMDQYMASAEKQLLGTETVQAMRSKGVTSVICGLSANDISDSFLDAGANNFILKPFPCKRDELQLKLRELLPE